MFKNSKSPKLDFSIAHEMAVAFASARMSDHKYPDDIGADELRDCRYSDFLVDYAYVIGQYQKAIEAPPTSTSADSNENSLNISVTIFDSILKLNADSD